MLPAGTILAGRIPEPGYYEVGHVYQNIKATLADGKLTIRNKNYFRPLDYVEARWTLYKNGRPTEQTGTFDVASIGPQQSKTFALPVRVPRTLDGYDLRVEFKLKADDGLLKKGFVVAADQMELQKQQALPVAATGKVTVEDTEKALTLSVVPLPTKWARAMNGLSRACVTLCPSRPPSPM